MALSGTLDTFALPDVLRLLASTEKSGRLRVSGNRGSGSVWVSDGEVVASELTSINSLDPSAVDVVFGLLRFDAGSFTFEADAVAPNAGPGMAMDPILSSAEHMLVEWKSIEEVVPSLDVWVGLLPELSGPDVMVDAMRWRCIAAVGAGVQVGLVAETLGLNEVDACRLVKELIELGLLSTIDAPVEFAPEQPIASMDAIAESEAIEASDSELDDEPEPEPELLSDTGSDSETDDDVDDGDLIADLEPQPEFDPLAEVSEFAAGPSTVPALASLASSDDVAGDMAPIGFDAEPMAVNGDASADAGGMFGAATEAEAEAEDLNPAEMARQLANLSPKAAKAVAAAAKASTEAEREAALAAVEAEDGSVNRGLLLKFLGSVDS
ncbi:MAG: DUF4388 domain-containing protein [Actinomycetota bacterium]